MKHVSMVTKLERFRRGRYTYYRIYVPRELIEEVLGWKDVRDVELIPMLVDGKLCLLVRPRME